jgi:hypothetical protein
MAMTRPYPSHTLRSEIRPEKLSDEVYVSEIENKKRGPDGPPEFSMPAEVPMPLGVSEFSGF